MSGQSLAKHSNSLEDLWWISLLAEDNLDCKFNRVIYIKFYEQMNQTLNYGGFSVQF